MGITIHSKFPFRAHLIAVIEGDSIRLSNHGSLHINSARDASAERDPLVLPEWEVIDLQDYRNRHATYVGRDEGLQFLRRRVPVMATWDDHETTNDSHGDVNNVDAENHQEVCPVDASATDVEKNENQCDRDEGDAVTRFEFAAQAFMEWLPLRYVPGNMGQLQVGQITKTIEWGSLATIVGLDTRMSYRSQAGGSGKSFVVDGHALNHILIFQPRIS